MGFGNLTEFFFLGLFHNENVKAMCAVMFLLCYLAILCGNLVVLNTTRGSRLSEQPMYYFLSYLSFMDVCFTSIVAPKLIIDLFVKCNTISYNGSIAQMFYAQFFGASEIFILVAMAYDRYVAICQPLYYMITMSRQVCYILVIASAIGAFYTLTCTCIYYHQTSLLWHQ